MFAIRLLNYGIYEEDYIKGTKESIANPDEEDANNNIFIKAPTKINYNPVTVKIDTKHKNMFDDYSNAYELYKSFILTYPIISLLSIGLFIIIMLLYMCNFIYIIISVINLLYILVIGIVYLFIGFMVCNSMVIKAVIFIISGTYQLIGGLYSGAIGIFNVPILGSILKIILFLILITALLNSNISVITMLILYAYYKIWFNFDINTLHKDAKKDAKIISEHSNSSTIFKSGVLKSGVGAAISMARLDLYQHSYFMNLYENAYENYVEKIAEIESYKANKHLRDSSTTNDSEAAEAAEAEAEAAKAEAEAELKNKNKEFEEKVDNVNIAKSERRKVEKKLLDFDSENDRTLKDTNMELYKDKLAKRIDKSNLNDEEINKIKKRQKDILDTKKDLRQQVSKLKTSENKARSAIKPPLINTNIEGLMNSGVDKAKSMFDNIKIDPRALLKPKA